MTQFVSKEALQKMVTLQKGYIDASLQAKQDAFTVGTGLQLTGGVLSITVDHTIYKIVTALPSAPAAGDENKIFLVLSADSENGNTYTEYIYLASENKWEKFGTFKPEVDLTPYLKIAELTSAVTANGFSFSKAGTKFFEMAIAASDFTGTAATGKFTLALKDVITAQPSGFYKFQVDAKGRVVAVAAVAEADITGLGFSTTTAMSNAISAAVKTESDRAKEVEGTLASAMQTANSKISTLEEAEANRSVLTEAETETLFNSIYGA